MEPITVMIEPLTGEALRRFRHDLRTPLNHIIGFADILLDDAEDGGRTAPVPALRQIKAGGYALLDSMQAALPGEVESVDRAQLEQVAEVLRPPIAELVEMCAALRNSGAFHAEPDALENLDTITAALHRMGAILHEGVLQLT
jgi:signal transduction histidine kinase